MKKETMIFLGLMIGLGVVFTMVSGSGDGSKIKPTELTDPEAYDANTGKGGMLGRN